MKTAPLWTLIRPHDTVTIATSCGALRKGRAVIVTPTHVVLNGGGRHGIPLIADDSNTVGVQPSKCKK
jgi:hypothetical protein